MFAALNLSNSAFIGLVDFSGNRTDWHWISDNTTLTFDNWQNGEPKNNPTRNCVRVRLATANSGRPAGAWFVSGCTSNAATFCDTDLVSESLWI